MGKYTFEGRVRRPLSKKLNPLWWWGNDDEPDPPVWYYPDDGALRRLWWYSRNPFHNLTWYVLGVVDRNYTVVGNGDPSQAFHDGWKWALILTALPRPYLSYRSEKREFYMGWQPVGKLGFRLTLRG